MLESLVISLVIKMSELTFKIPDGLDKIVGDMLNRPETKAYLNAGIEERLKTLILFEVVNKILSKSELTDERFDELVDEYRDRLAARYGVA